MTDRHRMTAELLNWNVDDLKDPTVREKYLMDRAILEIAYSAVRSRGLIPAYPVDAGTHQG